MYLWQKDWWKTISCIQNLKIYRNNNIPTDKLHVPRIASESTLYTCIVYTATESTVEHNNNNNNNDNNNDNNTPVRTVTYHNTITPGSWVGFRLSSEGNALEGLLNQPDPTREILKLHDPTRPVTSSTPPDSARTGPPDSSHLDPRHCCSHGFDSRTRPAGRHFKSDVIIWIIWIIWII